MSQALEQRKNINMLNNKTCLILSKEQIVIDTDSNIDNGNTKSNPIPIWKMEDI